MYLPEAAKSPNLLQAGLQILSGQHLHWPVILVDHHSPMTE